MYAPDRNVEKMNNIMFPVPGDQQEILQKSKCNWQSVEKKNEKASHPSASIL